MKASQLNRRHDLLLLVPGVFILLLSAYATTASAACEDFKTCEICTNNGTNLNCSWVSCNASADSSYCTNETLNTNCTVVSCAEPSPVPSSTAATSPAASTSSNQTTPASTTLPASTAAKNGTESKDLLQSPNNGSKAVGLLLEDIIPNQKLHQPVNQLHLHHLQRKAPLMRLVSSEA
ncbi:sialomucin core protein 24 isoform X2 [Xenopus laevis]|uniref:Sialomucin core protein 24 isoform X2 n=1 Tax=Xenopus laevis TaxID=8355 RepID=A0A8J0VBJ7_XENLA|nr:sialomucin core protein 24 isoform X2 [Xenopus laevis]